MTFFAHAAMVEFSFGPISTKLCRVICYHGDKKNPCLVGKPKTPSFLHNQAGESYIFAQKID